MCFAEFWRRFLWQRVAAVKTLDCDGSAILKIILELASVRLDTWFLLDQLFDAQPPPNYENSNRVKLVKDIDIYDMCMNNTKVCWLEVGNLQRSINQNKYFYLLCYINHILEIMHTYTNTHFYTSYTHTQTIY